MLTARSVPVLGPWQQPHETFIERPLYTGLAIDPPNPVEIDDAIEILDINHKLKTFEARVHIANAALLFGTEWVDLARQEGWSRYFEHRPHDLMLPRVVTEPFNLDQQTTDGVPAITIYFGFSARTGVGGEHIERSRVICDGTTYADFFNDYRHKEQTAVSIVEAARRLVKHTALDPISGGDYFSHDVVGRFMVIANFIVAKEMGRQQIPWLFRNHSKLAYETWDNKEEREQFERMRVALYGATALKHEALRLKRYCHFTSPLRRFADLANHINLEAHMRGEDPPYSHKDIKHIARELTALFVSRSRCMRDHKTSIASPNE